MFFYKPKENFAKFLRNVIILGAYVFFVFLNIFLEGFAFSNLRVFFVGATAAVIAILVDNKVVHGVCLGVLGTLLLLNLSDYLTISFGGSFFEAGFPGVMLGIGFIFRDLACLAAFVFLVFVVLNFFLKVKAFDVVLNILLMAMVGSLAIGFLFGIIGGIAAVAEYGSSSADYIGTQITYLAPAAIAVYFFFNLDEVGSRCILFGTQRSYPAEPKEETPVEEEQVQEAEVVEPAQEEPVEEAETVEEAEVVEAEPVE